MRFLLTLFLPIYCLAYNVDPSQISVSGLSSGAYMAGQLQVAHSGTFMGAGIIAGGPYFCAQGSIDRALNECMASSYEKPNVAYLVDVARKLSASGEIDDVRNLRDTRIYLISGKNDQVVLNSVVTGNIDFFRRLGVKDRNILFVDDVPVGHAFATENYGNPCDTPRVSPFISNCNYDTAGTVLTHIYGPLKAKVPAKEKNFLEFSQREYSGMRVNEISMDETAVAYVPSTCRSAKKCRLHVAIHGCKQTRDDIQDQFYKHTGYNEWAEANNIIVIYPQAVRSSGLGNPNGCWDWFGYTSQKYHTQWGPQIRAIHQMVLNFSKMVISPGIF